MPNHTANTLEIIGDQKIIDKCVKAIQTPKALAKKERLRHIDFRQIVPMPPVIFVGDLSSNDKEANPNRNWYDWNIQNWGTKWNAYGTEDQGDNCLYFETAWSSPVPVLEALSWLFPELRFEMRSTDEGGYFDTEFVFEKGEIVSETEHATDED
ncbi:hypothetical protein C5Y93_05025 [Blastopirellula marina]|uniref:YubB ferredoxin-like domain-containing protein n=2 Tax=Blastopirellula marina TaxID=124 RepID=A0A2S8GSK8_9BACT|nr:hypothetical protein C5Y93_05025 [Blastopirellula marina]